MKRVFYHAPCSDGFGAAWAASKVLGRGKDVKYVGCSYKTKVPEYEAGDEIYVVDFSFPRADLIAMHEKAGKLLVLDHHKTAEEDLSGLDFCVFDMNRSGAGLTWDVLVGGPRPLMIDLIEDRDLWTFRFPATKFFQCYMMSEPFDFDVWDRVADKLETDSVALLAEGEAIWKFKEAEVQRMCKSAWVTRIEGHPAAVVNATGYWSDIGHALLEKFPEATFSATFGFLPTGVVMWSLRGRKSDGFDVSEIARLHGGGGHRSASGMRTATLADVFTGWQSSKPKGGSEGPKLNQHPD